jgi:Leucine-rich repeat (LRR) protein
MNPINSIGVFSSSSSGGYVYAHTDVTNARLQDLASRVERARFENGLQEWVNEVEGQIEYAFRNTVKRRILDYDENDRPELSLSIHGTLTSLPEGLWKLHGVKRFSLTYSHLTSVPQKIENFTDLEDLDLGNNQLTSLPPEIKKLVSLRRLDLENNLLKVLPDEIFSLTELQKLNLDWNQLRFLSNKIENLSKLTELWLSYNKLMFVPEEVGTLKSLVNLDLSHNQLLLLPKAIGNLHKLRYLDLERNKLIDLPKELDGLVSARISHWEGLIRVDLSANRLKSLPTWMVLIAHGCCPRSGSFSNPSLGQVEELFVYLQGRSGAGPEDRGLVDRIEAPDKEKILEDWRNRYKDQDLTVGRMKQLVEALLWAEVCHTKKFPGNLERNLLTEDFLDAWSELQKPEQHEVTWKAMKDQFSWNFDLRPKAVDIGNGLRMRGDPDLMAFFEVDPDKDFQGNVGDPKVKAKDPKDPEDTKKDGQGNV